MYFLIPFVSEPSISTAFHFNFKKKCLDLEWITSDVANISWKWKTVIAAVGLAHFQLLGFFSLFCWFVVLGFFCTAAIYK